MSYTDMVDHSVGLQSAFTAIARIPKPVVAAVTGYALGGGCELALCADMRIAAEDARLGQPEILLGIIPGAGGTQRLPRLVGPSRAKDLIFTGRFVGAEEALRIGLVDQVVPDAEVYSAALAWAAQFARGPAYALRAAKEAIDHGLEADSTRGWRSSGRIRSLFATKDRAHRHGLVPRERTRQGGVHRQLRHPDVRAGGSRWHSGHQPRQPAPTPAGAVCAHMGGRSPT